MKQVARLPLDFAHYGDESIRISAGKLPPGEYALSRIGPLVSPLGNQSLFCFGVD
jgi:hypothetical protein